jgi:hypothetical protein
VARRREEEKGRAYMSGVREEMKGVAMVGRRYKRC